MKFLACLFFYFSGLHFGTCFSIEDVLEKFGTNPCIPGYIVSSNDGAKILSNTVNGVGAKANENYNSILEVISDKEAKSTLSQLHELADYNKIEYKYELQKEEGPPHDRIFTVTLKLGDEKYENTGRSKKDAQRMVAVLALKMTGYDHPPTTSSLEGTPNESPTVLLNNIANKLGFSVTYEFLSSPVISGDQKSEGKTLKTYVQKLNSSMETGGFKKYEDTGEKGPFHVVVTVDKDQFFASAHTKQEAKHRAAEIALEALLSQSIDKQSICYKDPMSEDCKDKKNQLKSPITLVQEAAQIRNMEVQFELIAETGPSHRREFTTQCTLGEFATQGTGSSKKESKRVAAAMMLENLPYLPEIPLENHIVGSLKSKGKKKKKKNKMKNAEGTISSFVNSMVENVLGGSQEETKKNPPNEDLDSKDETKKSDHKKKGHHYSGSQSLLLEMSNRNKFEVNFVDVGEKSGKHYTLAVLLRVPTYLCLGFADNPKLSKELAADNALQLLSKQGLFGDLKETETVVDEGECPEESVSIIVDPSGLNMK